MNGLPRSIWECPECHYLITGIQKTCARFPYLCPRCENQPLSKFLLHSLEQQETKEEAPQRLGVRDENPQS